MPTHTISSQPNSKIKFDIGDIIHFTFPIMLSVSDPEIIFKMYTTSFIKLKSPCVVIGKISKNDSKHYNDVYHLMDCDAKTGWVEN